MSLEHFHPVVRRWFSERIGTSSPPQGWPLVVSGRNTLIAAPTGTIVFLGSLLLYALFPSRNATYADDSQGFAYALTLGPGLINSHHLYLNGAREAYRFLHGVLSIPIGPDRLLSLYAALCGALGLWALYRLLVLIGCGRTALSGALICAFSAGWWCYAIIGDAYVPAAAFLMVGLYAFARGLATPNRRERIRFGAFASAAWLAMMLHHQAHFAFVAGVLPGFLLLRRELRQGRAAYAVGVIAAAGIAAFGIYLSVHAATRDATHESLPGFLAGYAERYTPLPDQKRITLASLVNATAGVSRASFSSNALFKSRAVTRAIQKRFPYRGVFPYRYLVRNLSPAAIFAIILGALLAAILGLVCLMRGAWCALRERDFVALAIAAAVPQVLLFLWWESVSDEFWIWSLPVLALVAARGGNAFGMRRPMLTSAVAAGLFVSTFLGSTRLFTDPGNDIDAVNTAYVRDLGPTDLLIGFHEIQSSNRILLAQMNQGFAYFNVYMITREMTPRALQGLDREITEALERGGHVYVDPYLYRPPTSYLAHIRLENPDFERRLEALVARLRTLPAAAVRWVPLAATVDDYFPSMEVSAANRSPPSR